ALEVGERAPVLVDRLAQRRAARDELRHLTVRRRGAGPRGRLEAVALARLAGELGALREGAEEEDRDSRQEGRGEGDERPLALVEPAPGAHGFPRRRATAISKHQPATSSRPMPA